MPTDDKPFIHLYNGKYHLSWDCFYAMAENVYGPYNYVGSVMDANSFAQGFEKPTWPNGFLQGRHGSFFGFHNQWYFAYCDISQTGNRYFRDTFISYVHYRDNGEIALVRVDGTGVGQYDASETIQAEDYFEAHGISKKETPVGGFTIDNIENNDYLVFPNVKGLSGKSTVEFRVTGNKTAKIEIRKDSPEGEILAICKVNASKSASGFESIPCHLPKMEDKQSLCLVFKGNGRRLIQIDSFSMK